MVVMLFACLKSLRILLLFYMIEHFSNYFGFCIDYLFVFADSALSGSAL